MFEWESVLGSHDELLIDQLRASNPISSPHLHVAEDDYFQKESDIEVLEEEEIGINHTWCEHVFLQRNMVLMVSMGLRSRNIMVYIRKRAPIRVSGLNQGGTLAFSSIPSSTSFSIFSYTSNISPSSSPSLSLCHISNVLSLINTRDERSDRGILPTPLCTEQDQNDSNTRDVGTTMEVLV